MVNSSIVAVPIEAVLSVGVSPNGTSITRSVRPGSGFWSNTLTVRSANSGIGSPAPSRKATLPPMNSSVTSPVVAPV